MAQRRTLSSWRGIFGIVSPTFTAGSLEELIRLLPQGIGVLQVQNDLREHTTAEFKRVIAGYQERIAKLAEEGCDLISPSGAPPFMVQGFKKETSLVKGWERKFKTPMFTASQNLVHALKALRVRNPIAATYDFGSGSDKMFRKYLTEAGFKILDMALVPLDNNFAATVSMEAAHPIIRRACFRHKAADGILLIGGGWRDLRVIELLEKDTGLPVVHHVASRAWEVMKRFRVNEPKTGHGQLLRELPEPRKAFPPIT